MESMLPFENPFGLLKMKNFDIKKKCDALPERPL
jgi:hypothetical protein